MSVKIKTLGILLATLFVGFVAGATVTGAIYRQHLSYARSFVTEDGFVAQFRDLIGPLDREQRRVVDPLLRASGEEIDALFVDTRKELAAIVTGLESDLSRHLTEEQMREIRQRRSWMRAKYMAPGDTVLDGDVNGKQQR